MGHLGRTAAMVVFVTMISPKQVPAADTTIPASNRIIVPQNNLPPAVLSPVRYNSYGWEGFYLGVSGGGGWGVSQWSNSALTGSGNFDISGLIVGGTAGYNWQFVSWVFSIEGDLDWANVGGSGPCLPSSCQSRLRQLFGTIRGRVGYAFDRVFTYVTGGAAVGNIQAHQTAISLVNQNTSVGWTIGVGIEVALGGPWTAKLQYLFADFGNFQCTSACISAQPTSISLSTNVIEAGVNYRF